MILHCSTLVQLGGKRSSSWLRGFTVMFSFFSKLYKYCFHKPARRWIVNTVRLEKNREAGLPEGPFVFEKKTIQTDSNRWCIIYLSSTQSTLHIFRNRFLIFTSSIHAKIMHFYMFLTVFGQIVQMMMHHLHDRVCSFCFLRILMKNGAYTQCKTPKLVSKHAHFVTDRHTHRHTNILKFEALLHKRPFGQSF